MAKICNVCWSEIQDNEDTCKICGTKVETAPQQAAPAVNCNPAPQQDAPQYRQAAPATNYNAAPQQAYPAANYNPVPQQNIYNYTPVAQQPQDQPAAVSVGAFFGLNLLFNIPFIGFIFTIVMSFAPQNKTIKNFARSYLIWHIIAAVCAVSLIAFAGLIIGGLEDGDLIEEILEEVAYAIEDAI